MRKFVILLGLFFLGMVSVNAEKLDYAWSYNVGKYSRDDYNVLAKTKNGYVTHKIFNYYMSSIISVSKDGKKENWNASLLNYSSVYDMKEYNDYFLVLVRNYSRKEYGLSVFNQEGNLIKEIDFTFDSKIYNGSIYIYEDKIYVIDCITGGYKNVFIIDKEFNLEKEDSYENMDKQLLNKIIDTEIPENLDFNKIIDDYNVDINVNNGIKLNDNYYFIGNILGYDGRKGFILQLDKDLNVINFIKDDKNYKYANVFKVSNKYVAFLISTIEGEDNDDNDYEDYKYETIIKLYNQKGELLETHDVLKDMEIDAVYIDNAEMFDDGLVIDLFGFKMEDVSCMFYQPAPQSLDYEPINNCGNVNSYLVKYDLIYDIDKKVIGEGEITVKKEAKAGEKVEVITAPGEGYVLKSLKVEDIDGNEIKVSNNSFVMPNNHVVVIAEFVLIDDINNIDNPQTGFSVYVMMFLIFLFLFIFLKIRKSKNVINKI